MAKIAKMLAHFHTTKIDFEIRRDPVIFETIEKWSQTIKYFINFHYYRFGVIAIDSKTYLPILDLFSY